MGLRCESAIAEVNVYARGATVVRTVAPPQALPQGPFELIVPRLSILLDPGSIRARAIGGTWAVVSVSTSIEVLDAAAPPGPTVERIAQLEAELERLTLEANTWSDLRTRLVNATVRPGIRTAGTPDDVAARFRDAWSSADALDAALESMDQRLLDLDRAVFETRRDLQAAQVADAQASQTARMGVGHPTHAVSLTLDGAGPLEGLQLTYSVPAARWWPTYRLWMSNGGAQAELMVEAMVAQESGEDWLGVQLSLSTADQVSDIRLPELPSLRVGRAQAKPKPAFRPAPEGLDRLFAGLDRSGLQLPPPPTPRSEPAKVIKASPTPKRATVPPPAPPPPQSAPPPVPMPMPAAASGAMAPRGGGVPEGARALGAAPAAAPKMSRRARSVSKSEAADAGEGFDQLAEEEPPLEPPEAEAEFETDIDASAWLDHGKLTMAGAADARRGRLVARPDPMRDRRASARNALNGLPLPAGAQDPLSSRGNFDHRYPCQGRVEVPADGKPHRVTLNGGTTPSGLRFRAVPRVEPVVYREAHLANPFPTPLLSGAVDVFVEGSLLTTSNLQTVDRGGKFVVGLGVEDRIRVARNAQTSEEAAGLLGGNTAVESSVTVEILSSLGTPAVIEVLERLPVTDEKAIEVKLLPGVPAPERYDQVDRGRPVRGGLRWSLEVPAGGKKKLEYRYRISLTAKDELVGGNRRE